MAPWKYFLIGLGIGILGAILWAITGIFGGTIEGLGGEAPTVVYVLVCIGFFVMVGGPLAFWIILPVRRAIKNRRARVRS
jgi:drug/metabolite transporter (DMT)-like permease